MRVREDGLELLLPRFLQICQRDRLIAKREFVFGGGDARFDDLEVLGRSRNISASVASSTMKLPYAGSKSAEGLMLPSI